MKIFKAEDVREIDQYTIENEPISSIDLMERAATRLMTWYLRNYRINRKVVVMAGAGNNGGDALALARLLAERQYQVTGFLVSRSGNLSDDCNVNLERLEKQGLVKISRITDKADFPLLNEGDVVVDGLFGSGLSRVVEGIYAALIRHINNSAAEVISIDTPSGLFGEDNSGNDHGAIIQASYTLTFQFPFLSFFFAENEKYTGNWTVLDIGLNREITENKTAMYAVAEREQVAGYLPERDKFAHKGIFGHALVIAGSHGMMGAALLAGEAALRGGAGLVTLHIPFSGTMIVQTKFPEAIVSCDQHETSFSEPPDLEKFDAIAVGPGLGNSAESSKGLRTLLRTITVPLVIDADALNLIASRKDLLELIPGGAILTPHPLEFDRIAGKSKNGWERHKKQIDFSVSRKLIIVLKGANTCISFPDGSSVFNVTGNPGMATGGSGDVLTGIIVSLLAQKIKPSDAAVAAVFIHGLAGDLAVENYSQEAMIAGDIIKWLGAAFNKVKARPYLHEGRTGGVL
ncbi:MAG: NAD(P)H-hydrate dehydratase [Bacteroidales bacterium]